MNKYIFYCMNALLDGQIMEFKTDKEAIKFAINYEAELYKINGDSKELIYDPYDCFN